MIRSRLTRHPVAIALSALLASGAALANETTSSIRGTLMSTQGQPVTDAKITILHQPTGTTTQVQVNEQGQFVAKGLRVGGPYTVVVDSDTYQDESREGIYLNLGEALRFRAELPLASEVEQITVYGAPTAFRQAGSSSEFGEKEIAQTSAINRDIKEIVRQNPFAVLLNDDVGTLTVAGLNPKFNTLLVDGIGQNDDFGLNGNGYPTQRSPISLEAIEQVAINTSPMSARYGGFTGAQLNAVTKSGTNEVSGSVFYEYTDDGMAGDGKDPDDGDKIAQSFEETTYGGSVGLPLIKDKLFFFGAYEKFESPRDTTWGPNGSGQANETDYISLNDANEIIRIANEVYGSDIGGWGNALEEEDEKILAKLDWNISDYHRASLTYQHSESNDTRNENSSDDELNLSSYWYDKNETLEGYSLQLFSDWSDDFSTEMRLAYKDVTSEVAPTVNSGMGQVTVYTGVDDYGDPRNGVTFGTEQYRHANQLDNQNLELRFAGTYLIGDHELGFGWQYNKLDTFNMFVPDSLGVWEFDSIDDFENQQASSLSYKNAYTGNPADAAVDFSQTTNALFAEDVWAITDDIELTFGVRYERIDSSDTPAFNQNFYKRYGFANNATFDGKDIWLPRLGIKWQIQDNLQLRMGAGRFSGGNPNVWFGNSFSNDGITNVTASNTQDYLSGANPTQIPQGLTDGLTSGDGYVNALDPNFELPSDWRYSIGIDYITDLPLLGDNWYMGAEYLVIDREDDAAWVDLTRTAAGTTPGGRTYYEAIDPLTGEATDRYDLMLTNADESGENKVLSFTLSKEWENGIRLSTSYTNTDITEGNQGSSSTAKSNYQYTPVGLDRNGTTLGRGHYEVEHRWIVSLGYEAEFWKGYATTFDLFYERRSGQPITYTLGAFRDGDLGDQGDLDDSDYYLPYIPTGADDPNVVYGGGLTYEEFIAAANAVGLGGYAGGYGGKGTGTQPWVSQLDFRFTQELPGFSKDHRSVFYFDIKNLLNLLNEDWGEVRTQSYNSDILVDYDYDADSGQYTYYVPYGQDGLETKNWNTYNVSASTWQLKMGIRYNF
ncbi:TonB-dependent receptor [Ferrimonas aestuarii]|uniref:TonB-dependent receptor n=1 Tax=Ferrimonas aestuarii TaxID=2569539 RepID=A0A4U1BNZ2_9GAMM|nr:TonB-dependent receptor [Ferrimonas aestuarii]TKB53910.1 TonB-dependent receptor [Ferrimonas aestuarii]